MVQISPELKSFPEGRATLLQADYHNIDCCQCHLYSLLIGLLNWQLYLMENWSELIPWFDKTGTVLLTFSCCVNLELYSMRMKSFREHLRDMSCC